MIKTCDKICQVSNLRLKEKKGQTIAEEQMNKHTIIIHENT